MHSQHWQHLGKRHHRSEERQVHREKEPWTGGLFPQWTPYGEYHGTRLWGTPLRLLPCQLSVLSPIATLGTGDHSGKWHLICRWQNVANSSSQGWYLGRAGSLSQYAVLFCSLLVDEQGSSCGNIQYGKRYIYLLGLRPCHRAEASRFSILPQLLEFWNIRCAAQCRPWPSRNLEDITWTS